MKVHTAKSREVRSKERKCPRSSGDSSSDSSDPGRGRLGDVANQYLHSHGGRYQEFTQYCRVRSPFDLASADVRINRSDPRTQGAEVELDANRREPNQARQKFF